MEEYLKYSPLKTGAPKEERMIESSCRKLDESLSRLESLPGAFETMLVRVARSSIEKEKGDEDRTTCPVPLAEELQSYADRIKTATDRLFAIRDRVEL